MTLIAAVLLTVELGRFLQEIEMGKLYGLLVQAPKQEALVDAHCFGDCGKISMGGGIMTQAGMMMMCCHENCPHVGIEMDDPIGESAMTGEPIYLRALDTGDIKPGLFDDLPADSQFC